MNRILIVLLTFISFGISNPFLAAPKAQFDAGQCPDQHPLFAWQIQGLDKPVYLMGTIHFGNPSMYPLDSQIVQAIQSSEVLVGELALDPQTQMKAALALQQFGMIQEPGKTLKDQIEAEVYQDFVKKAELVGLPSMMYQKLKPWAAGMFISVFDLKRLGIHEHDGVEVRVKQIYGSSKPNEGLETPLSQIQAFDQLKDANGFLRMSLRDDKSLVKEMNKLLNSWKCGDISQMNQVVKEESFDLIEDPKFLRALVEDRNHKMVQEIVSRYLKTPRAAFIMVGAAHFVGDEGILKLLSQQGYELKQLETLQKID